MFKNYKIKVFKVVKWTIKSRLKMKNSVTHEIKSLNALPY